MSADPAGTPHVLFSIPLALSAAALPDPGTPAIVPFVGSVVAFVATLIAHLRGLAPEDRRDAAFDGAFFGTGAGLLTYLAALLASVR